jgi:benzoyl-CoA reductase/2-hydroxyglutaryl-CoA dehydratase subunit BcrC/BadD/HgdB
VSALDALVAAYERPRAPDGAAVAGYVGADVPRELVAAAGLHPLRLRGDAPPSARADEILGPGVDAPTRSILAGLLEGRATLDLLLLSHDSDSLVRLFTSLRVLPEPLPELLFLDLLHLQSETTARYDLDRLRELRTTLGRRGEPATDERLHEAIREANRTRRLLARVAELRRAVPPLLAGSDALAVIGAAAVLPAAEANRLLEALLAESSEPLPLPVRRVYVTGSAHHSPGLYRLLEQGSMHVVGEDHDRGEAVAQGLVDQDGDPLEALARHHHSGSALARRRSTGARAGHVAREAAAAEADLVLAWIRSGDDALAWGVPALRSALGAAEIPLVVLQRRPEDVLDPAEVAVT